MDLIESLTATGLTRQEAQLYLLLHTEGVMTGYEAAKQSGISRSNAYMSLAGLVAKGAARRIDGDVQHYTAVPIQEYCRNKQRECETNLAWLREHMPAYREIAEPFLTIHGRRNILNGMQNLIDQAQHRIYVALAGEALELMRPCLAAACVRGLKVVVIAPLPFALSGATVYHAERQAGQVRLIVDSARIMTGEIADDGESTCLVSRHQSLVSLFKEALVNEIKLITQAGASENQNI